MKLDADRSENGPTTLRVVAAVAAGALATAAAFGLGTAARASSSPMQQHETIVIHAPAHGRENVPEPNFAIKPGIPVSVTFVNESRQYHTFTVPGLHVSALLPPGSVRKPRRTVVTFTAYESGVFRWYCVFCPRVHHEGGMGGKVYAIIGA